MEKYQENEPLLPAEFAHLEAPLRTAQEEISVINGQIAKIPPDRGLRFELRPPGYKDPNPPGSRAAIIGQLNERKMEIKAQFTSKVDKETINSHPTSAKHLRESVDFHLSDSDFATMNRAEINKQKDLPKDLDTSQNFLVKNQLNFRASDRFENSLNFSKELEKAETKELAGPEKTPEIEPDKD